MDRIGNIPHSRWESSSVWHEYTSEFEPPTYTPCGAGKQIRTDNDVTGGITLFLGVAVVDIHVVVPNILLYHLAGLLGMARLRGSDLES